MNWSPSTVCLCICKATVPTATLQQHTYSSLIFIKISTVNVKMFFQMTSCELSLATCSAHIMIPDIFSLLNLEMFKLNHVCSEQHSTAVPFSPTVWKTGCPWERRRSRIWQEERRCREHTVWLNWTEAHKFVCIYSCCMCTSSIWIQNTNTVISPQLLVWYLVSSCYFLLTRLSPHYTLCHNNVW